jgi:putative transposase
MDEKHERQLRRQAIRLWLQGVKPKSILKKVQRSYVWLSKWRKRFEQAGSQGLHSDSRRPHTTPRAFPVRVVRLILRTRRRLVKQVAGLIGPRAIRRELRKVLGPHAPSLTTIKRVLQTHHVIPVLAKPVYFPKPLTTVAGVLHALDWTCRYLEDGPKVYAFHTLNLRTRACAQTIATDKSGPTVIGHCLTTWKTLGIPDFLQLDNDAAFCGGYEAPRIFGQFVRLCLYLGIELIFLPVAEPKRNGEIEEFNGLWGGAVFWERHHFASVRHVARLSPKFIDWYLTDYAPPALEGLTPKQAQRREPKRRLTATQMAHRPTSLPITAGRVHFIRQVKPDGTIAVFNETWKVSKRLAGQYVWVTLITHRRRLEIWYQRAAQQEWCLRKTYKYEITETVARLKSEFAHPRLT